MYIFWGIKEIKRDDSEKVCEQIPDVNVEEIDNHARQRVSGLNRL